MSDMPMDPQPVTETTFVSQADHDELQTYWKSFGPEAGKIVPATVWDNGTTVWDDDATVWIS